jgi:hypothetical protein
MKRKIIVTILCVFVITLLLLNSEFFSNQRIEKVPEFYLGVDAAYDNIEEIQNLIDEISSYTNLFVIGSTGISKNETKLDEACQYLHEKGLSFIIFTDLPFQRQWSENAKNRWGNNFLGFYFWDENGGLQLDNSELYVFDEADNYTDAGNQFVNRMNRSFNYMNYTDPNRPPLFTSDYSLYWFVYKVGYDVVLAQLGWNYSRQLNVALNRGAATMQNKDWGIIITWTYNHPPYIESGKELFDDLVLAYENGAKYILIFDSNEEYTEGILEEEHFEALEQFWHYAKNNPRSNYQVERRVAFVLPKGYGYGFRGPEDKIWGLWEADALSLEISYHLGNLLEKHGTYLDIIYDDDFKLNDVYSKYIFWNGTIIEDS